jgi:hypothetical protein
MMDDGQGAGGAYGQGLSPGLADLTFAGHGVSSVALFFSHR